jgi:hypothetical protein
MPFSKGQSGNAGGRPKELREVVDLARQHTPDAIKSLARIMNSEESPAAAVVAASVALLERGWGKPIQPNVHGNPDGTPFVPVLQLTLTHRLTDQNGPNGDGEPSIPTNVSRFRS